MWSSLAHRLSRLLPTSSLLTPLSPHGRSCLFLLIYFTLAILFLYFFVFPSRPSAFLPVCPSLPHTIFPFLFLMLLPLPSSLSPSENSLPLSLSLLSVRSRHHKTSLNSYRMRTNTKNPKSPTNHPFFKRHPPPPAHPLPFPPIYPVSLTSFPALLRRCFPLFIFLCLLPLALFSAPFLLHSLPTLIPFLHVQSSLFPTCHHPLLTYPTSITCLLPLSSRLALIPFLHPPSRPFSPAITPYFPIPPCHDIPLTSLNPTNTLPYPLSLPPSLATEAGAQTTPAASPQN